MTTMILLLPYIIFLFVYSEEDMGFKKFIGNFTVFTLVFYIMLIAIILNINDYRSKFLRRVVIELHREDNN